MFSLYPAKGRVPLNIPTAKGVTYTRLMESCTILNPYRYPFVSSSIINKAGKNTMERRMKECD